MKRLILPLVLGACLGFASCAALGDFFTPGPDGAPPPSKSVQDAASLVGGPAGQAVATILGALALLWQGYHAGTTKKRHAKYSSAKQPTP